jgi:crotonobetaine/carnitine-CoA ligase
MTPKPFADATLGEVLARRAAEHPHRPFLTFAGETYAYGEIDALATRVAASLARLGVGHGDRVMLMVPNSPAFVLTMFGVARLGAVEVPINTAYKGDLLRYVLGDSGPRALVVHAQWLDRVLPLLEAAASLEVLAVDGGEPPPASELPPGVRALPFRALLEDAGAFAAPPVDRTDLGAIMYTSGTTGPSKGVQVTHAHQVLYGYDWATAVDFGGDDVLFGPLPLFHALARTLGVVPTLLHGAHMAIEERFSATRFWAQARAADATIVHGIFGMVPILLGQPPSADDRRHRIRTFYIGPSKLTRPFRERFGIHIVEVFGATETGIVTRTPYGEYREGSCGRPNDDTFEVRIVDDRDQPVAVGETGEIVVRPKVPWALMTGYYGKPEATVEAFRNLWFHTGDFGREDEDGYVFFVDRKKDAIRRRGENISSSEVESAVNAHPAVLESAAIAVPSPLTEDEVKVCVVLQPGARLEPAELIRFLDERLPYFAVPRYVEVLPALPKTPNEKVRKVELRRAGRDGITDATWDRERHDVQLTR